MPVQPPLVSRRGFTIEVAGPAIDMVGDAIVVSSRTLLEDWGLPQQKGLEHQRTVLYTFNSKMLRRARQSC